MKRRVNVPVSSQSSSQPTSPRPTFDRGVIIILAIFLVVAAALAIGLFKFSQNFFATTNIIKVGDAPPVYSEKSGQPAPGDLTATPGAAKPQLGQSAPVSQPKAAVWDGTSRVTLLLMGLDYRDWSTGVDIPRTDSMILFSIDPMSKSAGMISIPRDMWANVPGFGYSRINVAYRVGEMYKLPGGGPGLAMKTVEEFLGVPVDYYALVDFNTVVRFIDALGGLDMHIREPIKVDPIGPGNAVTLEPGVQTLDGATALAYARQRYTKDGDFDRSKRQQEVIMALRDQIVNFNQLPDLIAKSPQLYDELSSGINTNLTLDQVVQLAMLASQIDPANIQKGVFDPHKDVQYASVTTAEGKADVLVANPDQIRLLRDKIFVTGGSLGPTTSVPDATERMKAEKARVLVRNGTQNADLFQQAVNLVSSLGINIVGQDAAPAAASTTTIIDHTGKPYTMQYLIDKFGLPESRVQIDINPAAGADVEFILGSDWKGPQ